MKALPIAGRELRVVSRRPKTHRARWMNGLVALFMCGWTYWAFNQLRGGGTAGAQTFAAIGNLFFVMCLFAGMANTADCLSEEKREGTLGLLFLTDLRGYDIVIGKLLATSLNSFYGVLAIFPALALSLIVGGVQGSQVWQLALALLNTLFFSLTAGLFISSISREQKRASNATSLLVIFFWLGLQGLSESMRRKGLYVELAEFLSLLSPATSMNSVFGLGANARYWQSLLITHGIGWMFFGLACWIIPKSWQDKPIVKPATRWRAWFAERTYGDPVTRSNVRTRLLARNAFLWLASRDRLRPAGTWLLLAGVVATMAGLWISLRPDLELIPTCLITLVIFHTILKLEFSSVAARGLAEERHAGTLELILSTPLQVTEIVRGQWLALLRHFTGPVLVTVLGQIAVIGLLSAGENGSNSIFPKDLSQAQYSMLLFVAVTIILVADLFALGCLGMWTALNTRLPAHAPGYALMAVVFLPWLILMLGFSAGAIARPVWLNDFRFWMFILIWFTLGVINDLAIAFWARRKVLQEFRIAATQRFQPPRARWWKFFQR
ncbi:MAG: ABC transporter permease [Pedosphaera sp.]|nr:ABC transporter permease [Pedosphaera sp.]